MINSFRMLRLSSTFCSRKPDGANRHGVTFDEESIRRKINQLKEKKIEPERLMPKFQREAASNQKVKEFRQKTGTEHLFEYSDPRLEPKPTYNWPYTEPCKSPPTRSSLSRWTNSSTPLR